MPAFQPTEGIVDATGHVRPFINNGAGDGFIDERDPNRLKATQVSPRPYES